MSRELELTMFKTTLALLLISFSISVLAQDDKPKTKPSSATKPEELTPDAKKFITLCNELDKAYQNFHAGAEKHQELDDYVKYITENDPIIEYGPKLEALEKEHHGTHLGLMIARRLMRGTGSLLDTPVDAYQQRALALLSDYAAFEELPEILRLVVAGKPQPGVVLCLRSIIASEKATEQNRLFAKFMLARWSITMAAVREGLEKRLAIVENATTPGSIVERKWLPSHLAALPPQDELDKLKAEGYESLKSLSQSQTPGWQPVVKWVDEKAVIIYVDHESTRAQPRISELAAGFLFQQDHLLPGKPAPELELELIDPSGDPKVAAKKWSLADQKGKCVIIQFSFKGCGPCERMYPDLQDLAKLHPERLSIVSIMADQTREDTLEAINSGKITWGAHFDGHRGPLSTKWAVVAFPGVFIVAPDGKMVAVNYSQSESFKSKIAELCK